MIVNDFTAGGSLITSPEYPQRTPLECRTLVSPHSTLSESTARERWLISTVPIITPHVVIHWLLVYGYVASQRLD